MEEGNKKIFRILLWEIGGLYNRMKNIISWYELTRQFKVVGLTANTLPKFTMLDGYKIVRPSEVDYDYIIVFSDKYFEETVAIAIEKHGISADKFLKYQILQIPNLDFNNYIRLKESKVSIISNNCWGGIAYNTLGLECCSPFKNLYLLDDDYIKMLGNLKHYMEAPLVFDHYSTDIHSNHSYPVLLLGDIEIHFNHADDIDQAVEDWERRARKLNYGNLFVEMYTEFRQTAWKFCELVMYEKKVCFVPFETDKNKELVHLPILTDQSEFWETVNSNAAIGKNGVVYDLVQLLLYGQVDFRIEYNGNGEGGGVKNNIYYFKFTLKIQESEPIFIVESKTEAKQFNSF